MAMKHLACDYSMLPLVVIILLLVFSLPEPTKIGAVASQPSNVTDRLALLSFKSHLQSPHQVFSSWNDSTDVCEWYGVTCGKKHPERVTSLVLDSLELSGTISPSLGNLSFLVRLSLSDNKLHGKIPTEIGRLRRLQMLNLTTNSLEGEIPKSLSLCTNLQVMSLKDNKFDGVIPANLSNLSNLEMLLLKKNMLSGGIPPEFGSFNNLMILSLRKNNLSGGVPPSIGNISSLTRLFLSENNLVGSIPQELGKNVKLDVLDLMFNNLSGKIPMTLYNLSRLYNFGVGANQLEGSLPSTLGLSLPSLGNLLLYDNRFEGPIPSSLANASGLVWIELNDNSFSGLIPSNLGTLPYLQTLLLRYNKLMARNPNEWEFIRSLTNCTLLEEINLSNNNLSGSLPSSISNLSTSVKWLGFGENQIIGQIPKDIGNLRDLVTLDFEGDQLSGPIPFSIGKISNLQAFIVTSNKLTGNIPSSLCNLTNMLELYLGDNNFIGGIPSKLSSLSKLNVLDISHNNLNGKVPKGVLGISSISLFLNISHNSLTGPLPFEVGRLKNLKTFDISENNFFAEIPSSLGQCQQLVHLTLQGNNFSGKIPNDLKDLQGIEVLDLSRNRLSGRIPSFLETWGALQYLNLSFNKLEGEVPMRGIFSNISWFSVEGNEKLCGGINKLNLRTCSGKKNNKLSKATVVITVVVIVVGLLCVFFLACLFFTKRRQKRKLKHDGSLGEKKFLQLSYADIAKATNGFSPKNLIGSGGYGSVYKGILYGHKTIAIKVLNQQIREASKSFMSECKVLRNVRHRNLVKVLTACSTVDAQGNDFMALVYDFMPNGSLEQLLYGDANLHAFGLLERLNIAQDIALAIHYLHTGTEMTIVHYDLKPSNILLDGNMVAHVGDFGISRFLSEDSIKMTSDIKGSVGYIAPECGMGARISTQSDVYSYGVLLLELFTGKRPTDDTFIEGLTLHEYVQARFPNHLSDIVDPRLLPQAMDDIRSQNIYSIFKAIVHIGLVCSNNLPNDRMQMEDVISHLDEIMRCTKM